MQPAPRTLPLPIVATGMVALLAATWLPPAAAACTGDCDGRDGVTVDEIIRSAAILLGEVALDTCPIADGDADAVVAIDDVISAVNYAISGGCLPEFPWCGNGHVERPEEECDDGGTCIGGITAGTACTSDEDCGLDQPGVCEDGFTLGAACREDHDCPGSRCVRCRTFGGNGCAANCTYETSVTFNLAPGQVNGVDVRPGTSGMKFFGDVVSDLPLPLTGTQTLTIGKERHGRIPVVIKAASVQFPKIPVGMLACACVRAVTARTCGGTVFKEDGSVAGDCSDGVPMPVACPPDLPCTFVHGPGNSASGTIGCNGLEPIDVTTTQDCGAGTPPAAPQVILSGTGPAGSAILLNTLQAGTPTGVCMADFCTPNDPVARRGFATTQAYTTGRAQATTMTLSDQPGFDASCAAEGVPFRCADLTAPIPSASGVTLATAYPVCGAPALADLCVVNSLVAQ